MNYVFFAIGCYILMRAVEVIFQDQLKQKWCRTLVKVIAAITLYAALASLIVFYKEIYLLGFNPK